MILDLSDQVSKKALSLYIESERKSGAKIGLASGCFDLFHVYHLLYFERCKRCLGSNGILVVGIDSDVLVKSVKGGNRPIFNEINRLRLVNSCQYVSASFIMNSVLDHEDMVDFIQPDMVFKNQVFKEMKDFVAISLRKDPSLVYVGGGKLVIVPDIEEIQSTTEFIDRIKKL
jgi:cytidyltransferase-like protein